MSLVGWRKFLKDDFFAVALPPGQSRLLGEVLHASRTGYEPVGSLTALAQKPPVKDDWNSLLHAGQSTVANVGLHKHLGVDSAALAALGLSDHAELEAALKHQTDMKIDCTGCWDYLNCDSLSRVINGDATITGWQPNLDLAQLRKKTTPFINRLELHIVTGVLKTKEMYVKSGAGFDAHLQATLETQGVKLVKGALTVKLVSQGRLKISSAEAFPIAFQAAKVVFNSKGVPNKLNFAQVAQRAEKSDSPYDDSNFDFNMGSLL